MEKTIDFRSDKAARPTDAMIEAMAHTRWGDGLLEAGPEVKELEDLAADLAGKERALFVLTGIMANQLAVAAHTRPGETVILDAHSHLATTEDGFAERLSRIRPLKLPSRAGLMVMADIEQVLGGAASPTLICVENTHNMQGGRVIPLDYLREVKRLARARKARVHLDGARITNAHVKTGIPIAEYAACADSVMFCLSKGLCAPAGSMLCGPSDFIERVRKARHTFGGFPKQEAPLAAAGLVALRTMIPRLVEDHANAARLAVGLHAIENVERYLEIEDADTNMVFVTLKSTDPDTVVASLRKRGVLTCHFGGGRLRFVTHRDVTSSDIDRAIQEIAAILA